MTQIKIPFTKIKVEKYSGSDKPTNVEVLTLKVNSNFRLSEVYEKVPLTAFLEKMKIKFSNGAEKEIFNELLDDNKISFELSFEKEKVNFWVVGEEEYEKDDTKMKIDCFLSNNDKDESIKDIDLQIEFEPKFAGVVKITPANKQKDNNDEDQDHKNDKQKIDELEAKIKALEEKLRQKSNSPTNQEDQEVKNLKKEKLELEISSLQKQIKFLEDQIKNATDPSQKEIYRKTLDRVKNDLENKKKGSDKLNREENNQSPNNFPYLPLLVGGGGDNNCFINNSYYFAGKKSAPQ